MKVTLILLSAFLILITAMLMACDSRESRENELDRRQSTWEDNRPDNYSFELTVIRSPSPELPKPVRFRIIDSVVESVTYVGSGDTLEHDEFGPYGPINSLFDTIRIALVADEVLIDYDPQFGFPTSISIDFSLETADDEIIIEVSDFTPE